ncbi:MAG: hypothetical protein HY515_03275 [Candidatus Aenigmarchaeota archaeon]|nr:hypothetical protein [Candidatus Aenigmarchaeota archaeon]
MQSGIFRYSSNKPTRLQGYWQRPFAFLADLFTGVEERHETDYFSQYFVEEMVRKHHFPVRITFPEVWTNRRTRDLKTKKAGMEIKSITDNARLLIEEWDTEETVLREDLDTSALGNDLRNRIEVQIYGAPVFDIKFLAYKSGRSKMTITRKEHAYPLG